MKTWRDFDDGASKPSDIFVLAEAIKSGSKDNNSLLETLKMLVATLSEKQVEQSAPEVNVNFDTSDLVTAIANIPRSEAQPINVEIPKMDMTAAIQEMEARREAVSYEFNIKRGTDGKIVSVIANPVR